MLQNNTIIKNNKCSVIMHECTERKCYCFEQGNSAADCSKRPTCYVEGCNKLAHNSGKALDGGSRWRASLYYGGYCCSTHHLKNPNNDLQVSDLDECLMKAGFTVRPLCSHEDCNEYVGYVTSETGMSILELNTYPYIDGKEFSLLEMNDKGYCNIHYLQNTPCYFKFKDIDYDIKSSMTSLSGYGLHKLFHTECENDGTLGIGPACTSTIIDKGQLQVDHKDGKHTNDDKDNLQTLCGNCHYLKTQKNKDWENKV